MAGRGSEHSSGLDRRCQGRVFRRPRNTATTVTTLKTYASLATPMCRRRRLRKLCRGPSRTSTPLRLATPNPASQPLGSARSMTCPGATSRATPPSHDAARPLRPKRVSPPGSKAPPSTGRFRSGSERRRACGNAVIFTCAEGGGRGPPGKPVQGYSVDAWSTHVGATRFSRLRPSRIFFSRVTTPEMSPGGRCAWTKNSPTSLLS